MVGPGDLAAGKPVLLVGGTGHLGGLVARELIARGERVRALVRPGSDPSALAGLGIEVVRGDMLDRDSLDRSLVGVGAVVTTAIGYSRRKPGDSLATVDDRGNRNLVDAARSARIDRFIFTSVLTCDLASDVPHFYQKKLIEDYLEASGVPFVSLRPGAFFTRQYWAKGFSKGYVVGFGSPEVPMTYIEPEEVARCLALAIRRPEAVGQRIDLGATPAVSTNDLVEIASRMSGRKFRVRKLPFGILFSILGLVSPRMRDFRAMFDYFQSGRYIADIALQERLFGPVPTIEGALQSALGIGGEPSSVGSGASPR